jgi:hypothetical protein
MAELDKACCEQSPQSCAHGLLRVRVVGGGVGFQVLGELDDGRAGVLVYDVQEQLQVGVDGHG